MYIYKYIWHKFTTNVSFRAEYRAVPETSGWENSFRHVRCDHASGHRLVQRIEHTNNFERATENHY